MILSRIRQQVLRVLGSPELRPTDAAVLFALGQVLFTSLFALLIHLALQRPHAPADQLEVFQQAWIVQTRIVVPVNACLGRKVPDLPIEKLPPIPLSRYGTECRTALADRTRPP